MFEYSLFDIFAYAFFQIDLANIKNLIEFSIYKHLKTFHLEKHAQFTNQTQKLIESQAESN